MKFLLAVIFILWTRHPYFDGWEFFKCDCEQDFLIHVIHHTNQFKHIHCSSPLRFLLWCHIAQRLANAPDCHWAIFVALQELYKRGSVTAHVVITNHLPVYPCASIAQVSRLWKQSCEMICSFNHEIPINASRPSTVLAVWNPTAI